MFYNIYKKFAHITTKINFGGIMKEFVFVKKNKIYRQSLYYMLIAILIFQGVLFILNLALIRSNSNWFSVVFNAVFLSVFSFIIYKQEILWNIDSLRTRRAITATAAEILAEGANPGEMEIQYAPEVQKLFNEANCTTLGIEVPEGYAPLG